MTRFLRRCPDCHSQMYDDDYYQRYQTYLCKDCCEIALSELVHKNALIEKGNKQKKEKKKKANRP